MTFRNLILGRPDSFEQVLLWAQDMPGLAQAAARHFVKAGARHVKLIWGPAFSEPDFCQFSPLASVHDALNDAQRSLILKARRLGGRAKASTQNCVQVARMLISNDTNWACLYFEMDANAPGTGQAKLLRRDFTNLALRCQSVLQTEHFQLDIQRLASAERLQRSLFAISDLANSDKETDDVLRELHQIVNGLMYAENFFIVRYDPNDETIRFIYFVDSVDWNSPNTQEKIDVRSLPNSLTLAMMRSAKPVRGPSDDVRASLDLTTDESLGPDSVDWLGVPMLDQGTVLGAVVVQSYFPEHRYSEKDQALLAYVAQHILTMLQRREAQENLERRVDERTLALQNEVTVRVRSERLQRALFRIAEVSQSSPTMDFFYSSVHKIVGKLLHAKNFYIATLSDDGLYLEFPYSVDEHDAINFRRAIGRGLTEYIIRTAKPACLNRSEIDELARAGEVTVTGTKSVSWMGVPLLIAGKVKGVIALQSYTDEHHYGQSDEELVSFVALHIANALERRLGNEKLKNAYSELEQRVQERTHELAHANSELRAQIFVRERMELKLKHETLHDALTGLPNRSHLLAQLDLALARYQKDASQLFAVLFLDLDRFKIVNDSVGHLVGDELLKVAAQRISACINDTDSVSRLGGDEFSILIKINQYPKDVISVADRIISAFDAPIRILGKELFTSVSIGIAVVDGRYQNPEELLRDADVAMYRAKAKGRKRYDLFDEGLHEVALKALELENDLRRAIPRNEFLPFYQPIAQIRDGKIVGFEALMRWQHPQRGLLLPCDFVDVAQETGNLEAMDWQIYEQVCIDISAVAFAGAYVTVNVSPAHLRDRSFAERFLALMRRYNVMPQSVRLEVTEGVLLENPEQVANCLQALKEAGVHTLLDDFGTGYSSLSYLHRFPLSGIKIDRSFVNALLDGEAGGSSAIVRAIVLMANSLGLDVIAEGIETEIQRKQLLQLGLSLGQGFLFAMPASLEDVCERQIASLPPSCGAMKITALLDAR